MEFENCCMSEWLLLIRLDSETSGSGETVGFENLGGVNSLPLEEMG